MAALYQCSLHGPRPRRAHQTDSNRHDTPGAAILAPLLEPIPAAPPPASQPTTHATGAKGLQVWEAVRGKSHRNAGGRSQQSPDSLCVSNLKVMKLLSGAPTTSS